MAILYTALVATLPARRAALFSYTTVEDASCCTLELVSHVVTSGTGPLRVLTTWQMKASHVHSRHGVRCCVAPLEASLHAGAPR